MTLDTLKYVVLALALGALLVTFGFTFHAILEEKPTADRFLQLTQALLSWPVLGAALAIGGRSFLLKLAGRE